MSTSESPKVETMKTDIVVIGGGGSGLPAAVAAAEKGAKVIVLEKRGAPGGNSLVSGEIFAADSPAQERRNIYAPADHFFKYVMEWHHWKVNPRIVRVYINKTGDTIRWLEEKGLEFISVTKPLAPWFIRVGHRTAGRTGGEVIKLLTRECENLGVKIICSAPVKQILKDENGRATGVIASGKEREYRIDAKAVAICTGGYPANKELLKKLNPSFSDETIYVGIPEVVGDGLQMAIEAGAATEGLGQIHYMGLRFEGSPMVMIMNRYPWMVWVNRDGERFCDECVVFDMGTRGNALERQPGRMAYTIFDERLKNKLIEGNVIPVEGAQNGPAPEFDWPDLTKELLAEAEKGSVKISNSWDDIATWMGVTPEVLKATIDEYNSACDCGYDDLFLKDRMYLEPLRTPPYYVLKSHSQYPATMGGVKINHRMEVLDRDNRPIPGLYCAGMEAGGLESETYCYYLTGSILSWVINSGRMAGENAADYVSGT